MYLDTKIHDKILITSIYDPPSYRFRPLCIIRCQRSFSSIQLFIWIICIKWMMHCTVKSIFYFFLFSWNFYFHWFPFTKKIFWKEFHRKSRLFAPFFNSNMVLINVQFGQNMMLKSAQTFPNFGEAVKLPHNDQHVSLWLLPTK